MKNIISFKKPCASSDATGLESEPLWQDIRNSAYAEFKKLGWGSEVAEAFLADFNVTYNLLKLESIVLPAIPDFLPDERKEEMQETVDEAVKQISDHITRAIVHAYQREMYHVKNRLSRMEPR